MFTLVLAGLLLTPVADPAPATAKEALKPFNLFVGKWKGTGVPDAVGGAKAKEFWSETVEWVWQFKGDDVWLAATFDKNPQYKAATLRYLLDKKAYSLEITTADKKTLTYQGALTPGKGKEQLLTLDRTNEAKATERIVFTLLHHNRYLYRLESKPEGAASFARQFQVGVTKEGESFADVPKGPECVVSGGTGTMRVTYKDKTYYVCCSGCRDAFKDEPEKYIKEYEARLKAEAEKNGKK